MFCGWMDGGYSSKSGQEEVESLICGLANWLTDNREEEEEHFWAMSVTVQINLILAHFLGIMLETQQECCTQSNF